jgi:hypothetical protein
LIRDFYAEVAQLVERNLAKVEVAGSSLVFRSHRKFHQQVFGPWQMEFFVLAYRTSVTRVAESVDAQDLKSCFPQRK